MIICKPIIFLSKDKCTKNFKNKQYVLANKLEDAFWEDTTLFELVY